MQSTRRSTALMLLAAAALVLLPAATPLPQERAPLLDRAGGGLDQALSRLAGDLERQLGGRRHVAVVDFANLSGSGTALGQWLAEELLARLYRSGRYELPDRLYTRAEVEHAGVGPELTRPASLQLLGKDLGVQAVVTGTVSDLGPVLRVYARVYDTEGGKVAGMAVAQLPNTPALARLLRHVVPWQSMTATEPSPDAGAPIYWAVEARASSQYSDTGWNAMQATGAPNTDTCGDNQTAWATREPDKGIEWLEVSFAQPIETVAVHVRETFNPGAVIKLEAVTDRGSTVIWQGEDNTRACPGTLQVRLERPVTIQHLRMTLDTRKVPGWNEIDAVGLSGTPAEPASTRR